MKPYYRIKGRYKDRRNRVVIEEQIDRWSCKSKVLPKPEILQLILDSIIWTVSYKKKQPIIHLELTEPKVNDHTNERRLKNE